MSGQLTPLYSAWAERVVLHHSKGLSRTGYSPHCRFGIPICGLESAHLDPSLLSPNDGTVAVPWSVRRRPGLIGIARVTIPDSEDGPQNHFGLGRMIILTAAMMKSGSSWLFNMTNDLVVAAGYQDARSIRKRYKLEGYISERYCVAKHLRVTRLGPIAVPSLRGETYTIKTHGRPTLTARLLISTGMIRPVHLRRDPRDVAVSLYDHGEWIRTSGHRSRTGLQALDTMAKAMDVALYYTKVWQQWCSVKSVMMVHYEELLADTPGTMRRVLDHVHLDVPSQALDSVVERYKASNRENWQHSLHFNQGVVGRWRQRFTPAERELSCDLFAEFLPQMGYEL
jgi:hypothetical protein